jgi:hypothetical protein
LAPDKADAAVSILLGKSLSDATNRTVTSGKDEVSLRDAIQLMGGQSPPALTDSAGGV